MKADFDAVRIKKNLQNTFSNFCVENICKLGENIKTPVKLM